jgi:hypothetical protein
VCGVLLPKCENERVQLVPVDLCRVVQHPCRLATQVGLLPCISSLWRAAARENERVQLVPVDLSRVVQHPFRLAAQVGLLPCSL